MGLEGLGRKGVQIAEDAKESPGVQSCLPRAIHVGVIIPSSSESMIPSGLQKTKSIANDFVPIITLNEQTTSLALLGEKPRPL